MLVTSEIASITILVPYKKGNETINQIIPFKVFKQKDHYKAIPLIAAAERMITGLSAELSFQFKEYRIVAEAGLNEVNLNAINNIASELRMLRIV